MSIANTYKKLLLFALAVTTASSVAHAADPKYNPPTKAGQCYADVFSKRYLPEQETAARVYFSCNYFCFDNAGQRHVVSSVGSAPKELAVRDGRAMVCDGAVVFERMPGVWDFARVDAFWAIKSQKPEFRSWLRENGVRTPSDELARMDQEFYSALEKVGVGYMQAGKAVPAFGAAGEELLQIAKRDKSGRALLATRIQQLTESGGVHSPGASADSLVLNAILTNGRHLLP